jgi:hypothetical protein
MTNRTSLLYLSEEFLIVIFCFSFLLHLSSNEIIKYEIGRCHNWIQTSLLNNNNSIDIFQLIKQEMHSGRYFQHSQLYYSFLFFFSSSTSVVDLVQATLNNVSLILNIFCQLMVLPLAYQLTCITGNLLVNISIVFFDYSTIAFIK